ASQEHVTSIVARIRKTDDAINQIRVIAGNAGIALGVLHYGQVIYQANYGYRDVAGGVPPDSDTVFPVGSMTKAMVSAQLASLVEDGKVSLETKLSELIPEYHPENNSLKLNELATEANLADLLAHRLGLTAGNNFWSQKGQQVLVDKSETARIVGFLQPLAPFRAKFVYSNWSYGLAGEILERLSGEGLGPLLRKSLFEPLGMLQTTLGTPGGGNVSPPAYDDSKARAGAGACKSTVNDLLKLYAAWMTAANDQASAGRTSTPGSPFKRTALQWTAHSKINDDSDYGLGWVLTNLPAKVGLVGVNGYEAPELPVVAEGTKPRRLIYHQGSVCGGLSAVYLLPETETAIVVLGNSFDLCDTPDWISQVLLEAILDAQKPNDYVKLAAETACNALSHHQATIDKLAAEQEHGTKSKPLSAYIGRYFNEMGNFFLEFTVSEEHGGLTMTPQGCAQSAYDLQHYHHDVFFWPCDRDAESKQALYPQFAIGFHKVSFEVDAQENAVSCSWQIDKAIPDGETFTKK
ncbi:hypothetical protein LLEC1_04807, partial [Akanthomyces lecanii]